jgi:RNA polymerase sigma factor (sigma-70 family)
MGANAVADFMRQLRQIELVRETEHRTDRQLLECFLRSQDTAALETLVRRYAPMVWRVCRRTLFHHHDAEDAFQATFFVFVRKAASLRSRQSVAGWLHLAAHKTAQKARQMARIRGEREKQVTVMPEPKAKALKRQLDADLLPLIDDELGRLPETYRTVLVLCVLQDKTRAQAARQLGLAEGTVGSRLARGRALLTKRLARRGVTVSGAAVAALLSGQAVSATVPGPLLASTIRVAGLLAAGEGAGAISAQVSALTKGVLKAMVITKGKVVLLVLSLVALVPSGGLWAHHALTGSLASSSTVNGPDMSLLENAPEVRDVERPWPLPDERVGLVRTIKSPKASGAIKGVAFSPGGRFLVSCGNDGFVRQYDVDSGKELWAFDCQAPGLDSVRDVAVSPDGTMVLVAVQDNTVRLLDMATGNELRRFVGHKARILGVSFSPNNRFALSGSGTWDSWSVQDNIVRMWDVATGNEIRRFEGHTAWVGTPVFSPDGRFVLSPSADRTVRLWDARTGDQVRTFIGHTGFIRTAVFSRDGRLVLSGSEDSTLRLWNVATGLEVQRFTGHRGIVEAVVLSSDAGRALSAGKDGTLRLWDVADGKELLRLKGHTGPVDTVALTPNGKYALTGGTDGTVRLWRLPDPERSSAPDRS